MRKSFHIRQPWIKYNSKKTLLMFSQSKDVYHSHNTVVDISNTLANSVRNIFLIYYLNAIQSFTMKAMIEFNWQFSMANANCNWGHFLNSTFFSMTYGHTTPDNLPYEMYIYIWHKDNIPFSAMLNKNISKVKRSHNVEVTMRYFSWTCMADNSLSTSTFRALHVR